MGIKSVQQKTAAKIYKTNVMSVLLYESECWKINKKDGERLNTFHTRRLRRILHIFWPDTIYNVDLHKYVEMASITDTSKARRWQWIGHVLRLDI